MIKSLVREILLNIVKLILNSMNTKRHLVEFITDGKDIYQDFYNEVKKRSSSFDKIVFINPNNYPMQEFGKLKEYIPELEYIDIDDDDIHNLSMDKLIALIKAPVIISTQESNILNSIGCIDNQKLIYLWHACGSFKKVGNVNPMYYTYRKPDYVIVSSEKIRQNYADSLEVPIENVVALGIPRTELYLDSQYIVQKKEEFCIKYPHLKNKKIYLYTPTFNNIPFQCFSGFDLHEISQLLNDDEILIYKLHPKIILTLTNEGSKDICDFENINDNIIDLSSEDIDTLLINSDVNITDYSSAFIDAMLIDKPVVFVAPKNIEKQLKKDFFIDYTKDLPGEIVYDGKATTVLKALRNATIKHPNYQKFKEFHLDACKGDITKRVADFINEVYNGRS